MSWLLAAGLTLLADQASKQFVLWRFARRVSLPPGSAPWIRVVQNSDVSFGLVVRDKRVLVLMWGVAVLTAILLMQHTAFVAAHAMQIGLGAAIGGATGNLLDILRRGAVLDFINLRIWPVFNVADVAIVLGSVAAMWSLFATQLPR